jgi:hypothetical protein
LYQSNTGQTQCIACPANTYSASGASTCSDCPSGLGSVIQSTVSIACTLSITA